MTVQILHVVICIIRRISLYIAQKVYSKNVTLHMVMVRVMKNRNPVEVRSGFIEYVGALRVLCGHVKHATVKPRIDRHQQSEWRRA